MNRAPIPYSEYSLAEALRELGSPSPLVRRWARERALATGAGPILEALREEERLRQIRKKRWRWIDLIIMPVFMLPGLLLESPILSGVGFGCGILTVIPRTLHEDARRWQQEAASLLTELDGDNVTLGLVDALDYSSGNYHYGVIRPALAGRLNQLDPSDRGWFTAEYRGRLFQRLGHTRWDDLKGEEYRFTLRLIESAATLCATEAIPHLERLSAHPAFSNPQKECRLAARRALSKLAPIAERLKPGEKLLRPADEDTGVLLHPAAPQESETPEALLRPAQEEQMT